MESLTMAAGTPPKSIRPMKRSVPRSSCSVRVLSMASCGLPAKRAPYGLETAANSSGPMSQPRPPGILGLRYSQE
ncbi:hypothetical protein StrepF001_11280 [Streptomyces sp. F001]|nr:hypothetical protein StrepF001_11280 [Streptomyces sp. F001]